MYQFPIQYDEPLFRPPSEGQSIILQITLGCSWNKCSFCEMYTSKQFRIRKEEDIFADINALLPYADQVRKIFLADGDPLVLSTNKLLSILNKLNSSFPRIQRISAYASPTNLLNKTESELAQLKNAGLNLLYIGLESGDNTVLGFINKGADHNQMIEALNKSQKAGLKSSVMIINGVGGRQYSKQHAINSAKLINAIQPKYLSTLVLHPYKGMDYLKSRINVEFEELNKFELIEELKLFIQHLELEETIFRSDHASNHLVLKGVIPRDKTRFLEQIENIITQ
ncbi:MAG: radical SAM protein [Bacteroidales bacterium]|nr:radical SAM protein [Bacteroidales bacterium]